MSLFIYVNFVFISAQYSSTGEDVKCQTCLFFFFNNTHQAVNSIVTQFTWRYHGQRSLEGYSPWSHKESVEYIMRNAGLDEAQAGIKNAGRNINNLRYTDDSMLMSECEEEPKNLLMNVEEEGEKMA